GEVGHVIIHNNGRQCYCGQKGCADAYLASTNLSDTTDGNLELFFENVKNGEANAIKVWNEYLHDLALVVRDIRMLFNCKIVIGGYVGKYMNDYIEQFKKLMKSYCTFDSDADYVMACKYKGSPIAAGAALSYIDDFLKANN
ncbi:MAG: ROK family protein, partial [Oscillospiraceae bacterium]